MPVCIAGMHRSGTSAAARLLNLCGLYLGSPDRLISATADNPDGHWEHKTFVRLNDEILSDLGAGWDSPPPADVDWKRPLASTRVKREVDSLRREFDGREPWGWKDPRTSLTLPFWLELFPELKVVICLRNPLEVAVSLRRRGLSSYVFGVQLWSIYYRRLVASVEPSRRIVTHYEALLANPREEIGRLLRLLGLETTLAAIGEASSAARSELRHNRFTTRHLLAAGVDADVLQQYSDLCDWAQWSDADRSMVAKPAPGDALHQADRLDAQPTSVVDVAALDAELAQQEIEAQRATVGKLRGEVEEYARALRASRSEIESRERSLADSQAQLQRIERERAVEHADLLKLRADGQRSYDLLTRRLLVLVERTVPAAAPTLMVSRGDDALLEAAGRRISHFPQTKRGAWAGHYPADSEEAVAHLESLRADGALYLVIPDPSRWWLEHYRGLGEHLSRHARVVADHEDTAIIFKLAEPQWRRRLAAAVASFESRFGREPVVLDCRSELDLGAALPLCTVFVPPESSATLPYLDRTIDMVVCPNDPDAVAEARRVASSIVVTVGTAGTPRRRGAAPRDEPVVRVEWVSDRPPRAAAPRAGARAARARSATARLRSPRTRGRR